MVQCKVPASGGTEGDQFDLTVSTLLDANDLEGGVLLTTLLRDPLLLDATPTMQASGAIELAEVSSRGSILDGAQLLKPILRTAIGHLRHARSGWFHSVDLREAWRHPLVFEYINSKFDYVLQPVNEDFGAFVVPPEKGAELNDVLKTLIPISDLPAVRRVVIDKATQSIFTSGSVMVRPFHFSVDGIKLLPIRVAMPMPNRWGRRWPCLKTWGRPPNSGSRSSVKPTKPALSWGGRRTMMSLLPTVTDVPSSTYDRADAAARQLVGASVLGSF